MWMLNRSVTEIERVDTEVVLGTWGSRWTACWCDLPEDPRVASSDQVSYATCYTWMAECVSPPAKYVYHDRCMNIELLADLMRFRGGSHWLNVATGRWTDGGTVRAHRYYRKCMAYAVASRMKSISCWNALPTRKFDRSLVSCLITMRGFKKAYVSAKAAYFGEAGT